VSDLSNDPEKGTMSFTDRRVVVTGGANGIGAATAARFAENGARVVVLDVEPAAASWDSVAVDLADRAAVLRAADEAEALLGGVDVLVNCAGMARPSTLTDLDMDAYDRTLAVNLHAPVLLMREFCRGMAARGYGRVVNVTSVHARVGEPGSTAYDVSKAGLEAATRTGAIELAGSGVLVNAVAPGFVSTRMSVVDGADELESDWFQTFYVEHERIPLRRAARPAEIAETVLWLAGEANTYVTGQVLVVDGGLIARF
jgi:NAD(P)-dependent dehydrogenase (short-subunit alcohol dehydrogenase family)